jgi:hypothetical protein
VILESLEGQHSFIPKSGKHTHGLDWFYNGSASRSQKGLEISTLAIIDAGVALNRHLVGKLHHDAHLKYLYEREQKPRGAKRKYDGKVNFQGWTRFTFVEALEPDLKLYTVVVWHVSLKRQIRMVCLVDQFISKLNLDSTLIKFHPNYENLRSYGVINS